MSKEVVGCVKDVVVKKNLLIQLEDFHKIQMSSFSLVFLCSKEEVDMDELLSNLPEKEQGELLIIYGYP